MNAVCPPYPGAGAANIVDRSVDTVMTMNTAGPSDARAADPLGGELLDPEPLRADTPGCTRVTHLNNAGSALPPHIVVDTQVAHLRREAEIGGYEAHAEAGERVKAVSASVARLMSSQIDQVALVESATVAWDRALQAIIHTEPLEPGDRILIASAEYASNVLPVLQVAARAGATVQAIPDGADGSVDVEALTTMLDEDVRIVSITHAPSHNGVVNDVIAIGDALRFSGSAAWYLVDACQSVGQMPVDASRIGADFISATGRKFLRGPRGTGFLVASDRALNDLEPYPLDLHSATWTGGTGYRVAEGGRRFETWERSYAALLGMGAAIDYALDLGLPEIRKRIDYLATRLRDELAQIDGVTVRDRGSVKSGIVTITVPAPGAAQVVRLLRERGINSSLSTPDYAPDEFARFDIESMVRLSPHVYNTDEEIDLAIATITSLITS